MYIDLYCLITVYFNDPFDTTALSQLYRLIYNNRKLLTFNNDIKFNCNKYVEIFSQYNYTNINDTSFIKLNNNVFKILNCIEDLDNGTPNHKIVVKFGYNSDLNLRKYSEIKEISLN